MAAYHPPSASAMKVDCSFHAASNFDDHILQLTKEIIPDKVWMGNLKGKNHSCSHVVLVKSVAMPKSKWVIFQDNINKLKNHLKLVAHVCAFRGTIEFNGGLLVIRDWYHKTLHDELNELTKGLDLERILRCGTHITRGICELTECGIVSLEIKPENLLIDEKGTIFLSDFGLGDILKSLEIPIVNDITPKYAAPETWKFFNENGPPPPTEASNAWSFGCILLEISTGYFLWNGLSEPEIKEFVKQKTLPIVLNGLLEGPLFNIVDACLKFEPHKRPSFTEMKRTFIRNAYNPMTLCTYPTLIKTNETLSYKVKHLHEHILKNDEPRVMKVLEIAKEEGVLDSLLNKKVNGFCAVLLACNLGFENCLKVLFDFGAKHEITSPFGTPLCMAASLKKREGVALVKLLLSKGDDRKGKDYKGQTALHIAAKNSNGELVEILLKDEGQGDVNVKDIHNNTPLHVAICNGAASCAEILLESGADYNLKNDDGDNAFHIAAQASIMMPQKFLTLILDMLQRSPAPAFDDRNYRYSIHGHMSSPWQLCDQHNKK